MYTPLLKKTLIICMVVTIVACHDDEPYQPITSKSFAAPSSEYSDAKAFRKVGSILKGVDYEQKSNITMWDKYMGAKEAVYKFQPGENVVVYGKVGEYLHLSPSKDTALTGYILAGWIEFDHENKAKNNADMAAIPELKEVIVNGNKQLVVQPAKPNLEKILRKNVKGKGDSLVFDERHLLQDELAPAKRADSIGLFFEKQ
jgi:hypothetical protein